MPLDKNRNMPETIGIYCLYVLVAALPLVFIYQTNDIFELAKLTVLRLTTLVMIGAWAVMCYRERRFIVARTPIDYFILVYLAVYTAATVFSGNPLTSLLGEYGRFEGLLTIYNYAAVFFLAGIFIRENTLVRDRAEFIRGLMFAAIGTASLVSLYGIVQRFGLDFLAWSSNGVDITRAFSTMGNPIYIAAYLTIMISVAIAMFVEGVQRERGLQRVQGQSRMPHRSHSSTVAMTERHDNKFPHNDGTTRIVILLGLAVAVMVATLVLTFSRAGWGGMIVALFTLGMLVFASKAKQSHGGDHHDEIAASAKTKPPRKDNQGRGNEKPMADGRGKRFLPFVALLAVVLVVTAGLVGLSASKASGPTKSALSRMASVLDFTGPAYADRVSMWKSSVAMIKDRPVLGYGPDMFGTYYSKYRRLDIVTFERKVNNLARPRYQNRPHMDILQQGVSAGILGLASYIALWGAFLWFGIRLCLGMSNQARGKSMPSSSSQLTPHASRLMPIGIIAGLVGYIFQVQFSFNTVAVTPLVWLGMAVVFSMPVIASKAKQSHDGNHGRLLRRSKTDLLAMTERHDNPPPRNLLALASVVVLFAVIVLLGVLSVQPVIADYYFDQALVSLGQGNSFGAQGNFDSAITFNPYEPAYSDYAGSTFVEQAKTAADGTAALEALLNAIRYEKLAIALNPHVPGYRFNLGNAEYYYALLSGLSPAESTSNMNDALTQFKFAVANDPMQPDFHFNLASAYIRFNKKTEAIKEIKAGLKIDPTRLDASAWLATLTKGAGL